PVREKTCQAAGSLQKKKISAAAGLLKKILSHQFGLSFQSGNICLQPVFKCVFRNLDQSTRRNRLQRMAVLLHFHENLHPSIGIHLSKGPVAIGHALKTAIRYLHHSLSDQTYGADVVSLIKND